MEIPHWYLVVIVFLLTLGAPVLGLVCGLLNYWRNTPRGEEKMEQQNKEQELRKLITQLVARACEKYENAIHPAFLIAAHVDEIMEAIEHSGYKSPEQLKAEGWDETSETEEMKHIRQTGTDTHDSYGGLQ